MEGNFHNHASGLKQQNTRYLLFGSNDFGVIPEITNPFRNFIDEITDTIELQVFDSQFELVWQSKDGEGQFTLWFVSDHEIFSWLDLC